MKSIKVYFLLLFFLTVFNSVAFSQNKTENKQVETKNIEQSLSKIDSILVNTYFTEADYNKIHKIKKVECVKISENYYGDEIYNEEGRGEKARDRFLENVAIEVVVDVVVNTLFIIATFWQ